jgi:hypothetical protein
MSLDIRQILADFDDLVDRRIVLHGPETVNVVQDKTFRVSGSEPKLELHNR